MVLERIKQYIDFKGLSVSAFERSIGMSNASFGKSLKNGGAIGSDKLERILSVYPDLSASWLMLGTGEMLASEDSETLSSTKNDPLSEKLLLMLEKKDEIIRHQAEDIGKLREQIDQMRNRMQKIVDSANTEAIADVG